MLWRLTTKIYCPDCGSIASRRMVTSIIVSRIADARDVDEIIKELRTGKFANIQERSGRAQDKDDGGGLETLRRDGYM